MSAQHLSREDVANEIERIHQLRLSDAERAAHIQQLLAAYERALAARPRTAAQRLAATLGRPTPAPPTEAERREWEAADAAVDAEAARIYGDTGRTAALGGVGMETGRRISQHLARC